MSDEIPPTSPSAPPVPPTSRFTDAPVFIPLGSPYLPATDTSKLASLQAIAGTELGGWIERLRRAGINADRRHSPHLFEQFGQALRRPIDTIICNVLDADPSACLNTALASQFPLEMAAAALILDRVTRARRSAMVVDSSAPSSWFRPLRRACSDLKIRVEPISNDYPQADPTLLLYQLLGRRLRPGRLP
ncbi:MAG TPA: hypothetical protein VKK61_01830, partial [Tepidisphaeraceae bacterium]|nr:hypothetical protein [Tepidisphaeraceae bacterium]